MTLILLLWLIILGAGIVALDDLRLEYEYGMVIHELGARYMTISMCLRVENPSFFPIVVIDNLLSVDLRSGGTVASFYSGRINDLLIHVPSNGSTVLMELEISLPTSIGDSPRSTVLRYSYNAGLSMEVHVSGVLETRYLLFTGQSPVNTGWHSIVYAF